MSKKIIGYSYFGVCDGLQVINGGGIPSNFPVNKIIELNPLSIKLKKNEKIFRVSRIHQKNRMLTFISIYEFSKENLTDKDTYLGASIALYDCVAPASLIYSSLIGMQSYLTGFLTNDSERRFKVNNLQNIIHPNPLNYASLEYSISDLSFFAERPPSRSAFVSINSIDEYENTCSFIHHAINNAYFYQFDELYAITDSQMIIDQADIVPIEMDLNFLLTIDKRLLSINRQQNKLENKLLKLQEDKAVFEEKLLEKKKKVIKLFLFSVSILFFSLLFTVYSIWPVINKNKDQVVSKQDSNEPQEEKKIESILEDKPEKIFYSNLSTEKDNTSKDSIKEEKKIESILEDKPEKTFYSNLSTEKDNTSKDSIKEEKKSLLSKSEINAKIIEIEKKINSIQNNNNIYGKEFSSSYKWLRDYNNKSELFQKVNKLYNNWGGLGYAKWQLDKNSLILPAKFKNSRIIPSVYIEAILNKHELNVNHINGGANNFINILGYLNPKEIIDGVLQTDGGKPIIYYVPKKSQAKLFNK